MALPLKTIRASFRPFRQKPRPANRVVEFNRCLPRLSPHLSLPVPSRCGFHTSTNRRSSLFNLGGLSTSRENRYLSREKGIPRTEFSPHLELIRSSEVDTQRSPGSGKPSSSSEIESMLSGSGKDKSNRANHLMMISKADHAALKQQINDLEQRLGSSEAAARQLLKLYGKRSREGMALGGICVLLTLCIVYGDEMRAQFAQAYHKFLSLCWVLRDWLAGNKTAKLAQKDTNNEGAPPDSNISKLWHTNPRAPALGVSGRDRSPRQPWMLARLLWAADD